MKSVWSNLAVAYDLMDDMQGVFEAMDHYLELAPDDPVMRYNRATVHMRLKDYAAAISDATMLIDKLPTDPRGWHVRGVARMETGDRTGATADLEKFLSFDPTDEEAGSARKRLARLRESP